MSCTFIMFMVLYFGLYTFGSLLRICSIGFDTRSNHFVCLGTYYQLQVPATDIQTVNRIFHHQSKVRSKKKKKKKKTAVIFSLHFQVGRDVYRGFSLRGTHPVRAPSQAPCWIFWNNKICFNFVSILFEKIKLTVKWTYLRYCSYSVIRLYEVSATMS